MDVLDVLLIETVVVSNVICSLSSMLFSDVKSFFLFSTGLSFVLLVVVVLIFVSVILVLSIVGLVVVEAINKVSVGWFARLRA